ncbi:MAG TPA: iron ABC transporter permease [Solirubrobacteraceae bacterium]|nr:iron ABC transporter permease [Solirubrobacteraceae bacterium]
MALAAPARPRAPAPWAAVGVLVAALVVGPLLVLPVSFITDAGAFDQIAADLLPEALRASAVLALGVGAGTLLLGGGLAALVSFYDFPGRRWLDWALVLPLAMPAYVLVFVLLGQYDSDSPLQRALRDLLGVGLPEVRSTGGAIAVLTLVLYPYVYVLGRSAFLEQSRDTFEAARSLGLSHARAVVRLALPLARPALAGGAALAVMEALADFGAVNLLNYRAMTDAIYRVWYGAFDRAAALQLATVLVSLTVALVLLERMLRGRARYHGALARGEALVPRRLRGPRAWLATALPALLLALVLVGPLLQLAVWSLRSLGEGAAGAELLRAALTSVSLAAVAALIAVAATTIVVYGSRARPSRLGAASARLQTLGYAVPGTVVAVAVYIPLAWLDRRIDGLLGTGLLLTGSAIGLVIAYVVRFQALAFFAVESRMGRLDPALDDAAQSLGADRNRVLADVHLPLLWPGIVTAALLVFVEVVKELPATALLRPLGNDTLAIGVWEATKDSRFDTAALPALLIVAVSLLPVIAMIRLSRPGAWLAEEPLLRAPGG